MTRKMVNGKSVPLTPADVAALAARDAAWLATEPHRQATRDRFEKFGFIADVPAVELIDRLATSTADDIDRWFAADVTNFEQANAVLKAVCKILAVRLLRPHPRA